MSSDVNATPCSKAWMGYFLLTIVLIGFPLSGCIYVPLYLLSFIYPKAQRPADALLLFGIGWLMRVQPWLNAEYDLKIPKGGVLIASNHRSTLDVFLLLSRIRGIRVLAKSTLFYIPFLGLMMRITHQIPSERGNLKSFWRAMENIRSKLREGHTVHVFPEMTRCYEGAAGTRDFVTAPFLVAKETGVPIVPMVIEGTDEVWPRGRFSLRLHRKVRVRTLTPLDPKQFSSAEELCRTTRERINEALQ